MNTSQKTIPVKIFYIIYVDELHQDQSTVNSICFMRYETTKLEKGEMCSIDDYMERMPEDQKDIYFIVATNRETALASPYIEHLMEQGTEVMLAYAQIDQFVFDNLQTYRQKDLVSVEKSKIDVEKGKDVGKLQEFYRD